MERNGTSEHKAEPQSARRRRATMTPPLEQAETPRHPLGRTVRADSITTELITTNADLENIVHSIT